MRFLLKKAFRGFFAGAEKRARMWSLQVYAWQQSIKERGGELVEINPITNIEGNIKYFLLKIDDKAGKK